MALQAAFLFLSPSAIPAEHRAVVATGEVDLHIDLPAYGEAAMAGADR